MAEAMASEVLRGGERDMAKAKPAKKSGKKKGC